MMLKNLNNLYEVRKTVRFELIPTIVNNDQTIQGDTGSVKDIYKNLSELTIRHVDFVNKLGRLFFYQEQCNDREESKLSHKPFSGLQVGFLKLQDSSSKENSNRSDSYSTIEDFTDREVSNLVQFKYGGVEKIFRKEWFEFKDQIVSRNKYGSKTKNYMTLGILGENNFIAKFFMQWILDNQVLNKRLQQFTYTENILARLSDIVYEVQLLHSKNYLGKLYILFEGGYITHKNDPFVLLELEKNIKELKKLIDILLEQTKPSQSFGLPIEHISLNYYTRNKTPKEYEDDINKKAHGLQGSYTSSLGAMYGINEKQSIESLYNEMKNFKAQQKSAFLQLLDKRTNYKNIKNPFAFTNNKSIEDKNFIISLFDDILEDDYDIMLSLTQQIKKETNKTKQKELKEKRGKYFAFKCSKYKEFCEEYKKVAMEYGKRKAEVNALKRQKILAERERGWGFITKDSQDNFFLNTIPSDKTKKVYDKLNDENLIEGSGEIIYYIFSSITLRALDILCFKKDSSFSKAIVGKIDGIFTEEKKFNDEKTVIKIKSKTQLIEENQLILFYNEILEKQSSLGLKYRDGENSRNILKNSKSQEEFEINLKGECYVLLKGYITEKNLNILLKQNRGNAYKITSWDLISRRDNPENFTQRWFDFWSNENKAQKYITRINPEIMISFVEKDQNFDTKQTNNRRNRNRYLMTSTFSHFSNKSYINSAFMGDEMKKNSIEEFNKIYNAEITYKYIYGLDRGTNELVTLGLYALGMANTLIPLSISNIDIYKITALGLYTTKITHKKILGPDQNQQTVHTLYKNPSLFLDKLHDTNIFTKLTIVSCLGNLTCAKVIDDIIVLNGDVGTVKNLYEVNAKRLLYIAITEGRCKSEKIGFDEKKNAFYYEYENKGKIDQKDIYFINEYISPIITKEEIENMLNLYITNVQRNQSQEDISITKINHLKNAICANMVGVIMKLQEKYPGYIVWESLNIESNRDKIENKQNTFLGNHIIEKIYNRLQMHKTVPPILKNFRHDIQDGLQHGQVVYVSESETSSMCPVCRKKLFGHLTDFDDSMHHVNDFQDHNYKSGKWMSGEVDGNICNYHMKNNPCGFNFIKSGDDLATYNIAKKGLECLIKKSHS